MTKIVRAKYKINRRYGLDLWGRDKSPVHKRNTRPGQHGDKRGSKLSDYGTQLKAKQILKGYYANISEKKFRKYYKEADRRKGDTTEIFTSILESRLDSVIYRMKIVPTMFAARQFVSHKHIMVNGKYVNIASYMVKPGDVIKLKPSSKDIPMVMVEKDSAERSLPEYVSFDFDKYEGVYIKSPEFSEIPYPVEMKPNLVVEFYSR